MHFITKWDFGLSYNLQPSFAWYNSFQSSYGCFCVFFYSNFSFEACISFIYDPILIKPGQNVDILEVNNSYYYPFMIKPQLQASIEQNVPKFPIARPFFCRFCLWSAYLSINTHETLPKCRYTCDQQLILVPFHD